MGTEGPMKYVRTAAECGGGRKEKSFMTAQRWIKTSRRGEVAAGIALKDKWDFGNQRRGEGPGPRTRQERRHSGVHPWVC